MKTVHLVIGVQGGLQDGHVMYSEVCENHMEAELLGLQLFREVPGYYPVIRELPMGVASLQDRQKEQVFSRWGLRKDSKGYVFVKDAGIGVTETPEGEAYLSVQLEKEHWRSRAHQAQRLLRLQQKTLETVMQLAHFAPQHQLDLEGLSRRVVKACQAALKASSIPEVVCLCGSTRFKEEYEEVERQFALQGKIVLTVGLFGHVEGLDMNAAPKGMLDELHKRKIDLADRVYVINKGGYVGNSTTSEIRYALTHGKPVAFMEPASLAPFMVGLFES